MQQFTIQPDLKTRESVMLAAGRAQFAVREGDDVRYVKVECKRKLAGGSGYERGTVALDEATHVFISEKGYGTQRLGTYYPPKQGYDTGRLYSDLSSDHPHLEALDVIVHFVEFEGIVPANYTVTVESRCGMCGHKLEDPESVARGIGPDCAGKPTGMKILHASAFGQQPMDLAQPTTDAEIELDKAAYKAQFAKVECAQEAIASMNGDLAEVDMQIAALEARRNEIANDIANATGHLAELHEAAQS